MLSWVRIVPLLDFVSGHSDAPRIRLISLAQLYAQAHRRPAASIGTSLSVIVARRSLVDTLHRLVDGGEDPLSPFLCRQMMCVMLVLISRLVELVDHSHHRQ
jgi:hypothetical protein